MKKFFFGQRMSLFDFITVTLIVRLLGDGHWLAAVVLFAVSIFVSLKHNLPAEVKSNG